MSSGRNCVLGRSAGSIEGYSYSAANKSSSINWDEATLRDYIKAPRENPEHQDGVPWPQIRAEIDDILAYLQQFHAEGKKEWCPFGLEYRRARVPRRSIDNHREQVDNVN